MRIIKHQGREFVPLPSAAEFLGLTQPTARLYVRLGVFKTAKKLRGTRWIIKATEVRRFAEKGIPVKGLFSKGKR